MATVQRCPVCDVAWDEGRPERHVMTCPARSHPTRPVCEHEWSFKADVCVRCGATWKEVFEI